MMNCTIKETARCLLDGFELGEVAVLTATHIHSQLLSEIYQQWNAREAKLWSWAPPYVGMILTAWMQRLLVGSI